MTTIGGSAVTPARAGESAVLGAVIVALVPMGVLHVVGSTVVDPLNSPISDYVAVPGGYTLVGLSTLALAVAGLVLAAAISAARLPGARTVGGLLTAWSVALLVVAVFPTNHPGTPLDVAAWVHRVGGALVFALLPITLAVVAARARTAEHWAPAASGLRWGALLSGGGAVVFMVGQLPAGFGVAPILPALGLTQRVLFATAMVLLLLLARAARVAADRGAIAAGGVEWGVRA
ncbi:DUF998 domain-containing protein [Pseudonocardia sp.]|uniref:DUF998 domain-containing protein n=1 Tax=Pseudonocardia sp. TaxID=60912 RepID=UPI00260FB950|nr:DUF998 domain-containing protein [Pseudonocardia sp.]